MASPDKKAFLLRLPPDVWAQLERLAATELRSVNGQIEYLLRDALARRMGPDASPPTGAASVGTPERGARSGRKPRPRR